MVTYQSAYYIDRRRARSYSVHGGHRAINKDLIKQINGGSVGNLLLQWRGKEKKNTHIDLRLMKWDRFKSCYTENAHTYIIYTYLETYLYIQRL